MAAQWDELCQACGNGDMNKVLQLVNQGCNPKRNVSDLHRRQPIHYAAAYGHLGLVKTLIERYRCRPDWKDREGRTALHYACRYGHSHLVRYLVLDKQQNFYMYDKRQRTPMYYACLHENGENHKGLVEKMQLDETKKAQLDAMYVEVVQSKGHYDIVYFLVTQGCDPTRGRTIPLALHVACKYGTCEFVKHLVDKYKYDPEGYNSRHESPLLLACQHGQLEIVRHLVDALHCDVNKCHGRSGNNSLHVACLHNQAEVAKYLVEKGCDLTICNGEIETPLHIACSNNSLEMVRLVSTTFDQQAYEVKRLKRKGEYESTLHTAASILEYYRHKSHPSAIRSQLKSLTLKLHGSPLHIACAQGSLDIVKYLTTEKSWNPELQIGSGSTSLHSACSSYVAKNVKSILEVVKFLVNECNSDPMKSSTTTGESPMSVACKAGKLELVKALTNGISNVNQQDHLGNTPLHLACKHEKEEVVKYLVEHKQCNQNIQNKNGELPVHIACESKSLVLVKVVSDCDLNTLTNDWNTPLHIVCKNGTMGIIEYLSIEKQFKHSENSASLALHALCKAGKLKLVKVLATPQNVKCQDDDGNTPLHVACKYKHLNLAMYLVNEVESDIQQCNQMGDSPLHIACQEEALDIVQFLVLEKHCPQDIRNNKGELPLHIACQKKCLEMVKLVSECSVNIAATSIKGSDNMLDAMLFIRNVGKFFHYLRSITHGITPLHIACQEEALDIVRYLCLEKLADCNVTNSQGELPLHIACSKYSLEIVKLVSNCASPNAKTNGGDTPLLIACRHGGIDIVKYLLEVKQCDPKTMNSDGELPLQYACMHSLEMVQLVTNWDFEIKPPTTYSYYIRSGKLPFHIACSCGALDIVRYFIEEKHCDPRHHRNRDLLQYTCGLTDSSEKTDTINIELVKYLVIKCECDPMNRGCRVSPMEFACEQGNLELVKALTSFNVNCLDSCGNSPLHVACSHDQVEIVRFLAEEKYCDQNIRNEKGELALHIACRKGSVELVRLVINKCTELNAGTTDGETPLHLACERGSREIVSILTEEKLCDQSIRKRNGESALHITCRKVSLANVKLLTECDVNAQTDEGVTPLHLACMMHSAEIVEYLLHQRHCNPELADKNQSLPIHYAISHHIAESSELKVLQLLSAQSHANSRNANGDTPLHLACATMNIEAATFLTKESRCDQNLQNSEGKLALHIACKCREGDSEKQSTLAKIVSSNCNPNIQDSNGDTPLHVAVRNEAEEIVKYLVQVKKCDTTASNNDGMLPIHIACQTRLGFKTVRFVGSNCQDALDKNGNTPLHIACKVNKFKVTQCLIDKLHCNPNIKDAGGRIPLHIASASEVVRLVKALRGSNPNSQDDNGNTPLHIASASFKRQSLYIAEHLLKAMHSNADVQNKAGELPLHFACKKEIGFFELVCKFTKNPNARNVSGNTPLHIACKLNYKKVVRHLVERLCDANIQNDLGELPLHWACIHGSLSMARMVSKCDPNIKVKEDVAQVYTPLHLPDINFDVPVEVLPEICALVGCKHYYDDSDVHLLKLKLTAGDTPLHIACRQTNLELVKFLTEEMNCSCCISNRLGELPLHIACTKLSHISFMNDKKKNVVGVSIIKLVSNCDVDSVTVEGTTALHIACEREEQEIIHYLVETKKCKTNIQDRKGNTPLHIISAMIRIGPDILNLLCDQSSQTLQNNDGDLPLHIACSRKSLDWVQLVSNCDVNTRNTSGNTALHLACSQTQYNSKNIPIIQYLTIEKRCNANIQNDMDELPLHIACRNKSLAMVRLVSECDVNLQTENGDAPIHIACHNQEVSIIEFLVNTKHCNRTTPNERKELPIHIACYQHSLNVVKLVSQGNVDVNSQTQSGETPLHIACSRDSRVHISTQSHKDEIFQLVKYLVREKQCSLSISNHNGELPVHIACCHHSLDVVKVVSEGQVDLNSQTQTGVTPLHIACGRTIYKDARRQDLYTCFHDEDEAFKLIAYLVREKQCSLSIPNQNGELPVHIACHHHSLDIVKVVSEGQVDFNSQTQTGNTPLHIACGRNICHYEDDPFFLDCDKDDYEDNPLFLYPEEAKVLQLVKYLVREKQCSLSIPNQNGELPVHIACRHHSLDVVKVVSEGQVDLNSQTQTGVTPLHIGCREEGIEIVRYLVDVKRCDLNVQNIAGELPLHIACRGKASVEMVKLVSNCNVNMKTNSGDTPLHEVCKIGEKTMSSYYVARKVWETINKTVAFLMKEKGCNPNHQNNKGKSPLHDLCNTYQHQQEIKEAIQCLFSTGNVNPSLPDSDGQTPLMLTNDPEIIKLLLLHGADPTPLYDMNNAFFEKYSKTPPPTPLKVLVLGDASTGKTTLTLTLKCEGCPTPEPIAPQDHTAGIIPSDFDSETYGLVTFYDFAGQHEYYASHEAIIHCVVRRSPPVILLLVKLSEGRNEIKQKLLKWLAYIENQCVSVQGTAHLIIVGSHADKVRRQGDDPQLKIKSVLESLQTRFKASYRSCVKFTASVTMDCRQPNSMSVDELRKHLKDSSAQLRDIGVMNFISHCVYVCLLSQFSSLTAVPLAEVFTAISRTTKHSYYSSSSKEAKTLLPKGGEEVVETLRDLNDKGHILFLEGTYQSWIILNKEAILADLNGTIFAPRSFMQYQDMTSNSTGVVKFSTIVRCRVFEKYNPNMLVGFLSHMEFCQEIHDKEVLDILGCLPVDFYPSERYFFFPGLVKLEAPQAIWKTDKLFTYKCGWILQCTRKDQIFTPHFLQVLVLRLAFTFALSPSKPTCDLPVITRRCTVWRNGIQWLNRDGVEAVVEVMEQSQAVVVMLRCSGKARSEWACLHLRSAVICQVLKARKEFCPNVSTAESFIHADDVCYPLQPAKEMCLYSIESIAETVAEAEPFVLPEFQDHSHVSIEELLLLEPYADLGEDLLRKLFGQVNGEPSDNFLYEVADAIAQDESTCNQKKKLLHLIFKPPPTLLSERIDCAPSGTTHEIVRILQIGRDREHNCTISNLRKNLDKYSIFCGRNPLDLVKREGSPEQEPEFVWQQEMPRKQPLSDDDDVSGAAKHLKTECTPLTMVDLLRLRGSKGKINIAREIGSKYKEFGILLLNDGTGEGVKEIAEKYDSDNDRNLEILQQWINGNGLKPITWETLVDVLDNVDLVTLAEDIRGSVK